MEFGIVEFGPSAVEKKEAALLIYIFFSALLLIQIASAFEAQRSWIGQVTDSSCDVCILFVVNLVCTFGFLALITFFPNSDFKKNKYKYKYMYFHTADHHFH